MIYFLNNPMNHCCFCAQPHEDEEEHKDEPDRPPEERVATAIQGQLYVNSVNGNAPCAGGGPRPRSRSYDRNLNQAPPGRLGPPQRMLSCPVRLGDPAPPLLSPLLVELDEENQRPDRTLV